MVYDRLHNSINYKEWNDVMACLSTDCGKEMAQEPYKQDLPLHMVCERAAPPHVVEGVLNAYRAAAATRGKNGEYPLHIAAERNISPEIIVRLIRAYPHALDKRNERKMMPRDFPQKRQISREAICRPAACWIEDIEKEEYLRNIVKQRTALREAIVKIRYEITISKRRQDQMRESIKNKLEPSMRFCEMWMGEHIEQDKRLNDIEHLKTQKIQHLNTRLSIIEKTVPRPLTDDQLKIRSLMKSSYMSAVHKKTQQFSLNMNQIKADVGQLRHMMKSDTLGLSFGAESRKEKKYFMNQEDDMYLRV